MSDKLNRLVRSCMFGSKQRIDPAALLERGFEYRKNKGPEDFRAAFVRGMKAGRVRGMKAGRGKVEFEESEVAARLERVLKEKA